MSVSELVFLKSFPTLQRKNARKYESICSAFCLYWRKIQSKKSERLKKSENQDFSRRKGADILTYIKPDNTEKDDFQVFWAGSDINTSA